MILEKWPQFPHWKTEAWPLVLWLPWCVWGAGVGASAKHRGFAQSRTERLLRAGKALGSLYLFVRFQTQCNFLVLSD